MHRNAPELPAWSLCRRKVNNQKIQLPPNREQQSDSGNKIWALGKTRQTDLVELPFWFCRSCSKQRPRGLHSSWIVLRLGFSENFLADGRAFSKRIYITTFCSGLHKGLYLSGSPASPSNSYSLVVGTHWHHYIRRTYQSRAGHSSEYRYKNIRRLRLGVSILQWIHAFIYSTRTSKHLLCGSSMLCSGYRPGRETESRLMVQGIKHMLRERHCV